MPVEPIKSKTGMTFFSTSLPFHMHKWHYPLKTERPDCCISMSRFSDGMGQLIFEPPCEKPGLQEFQTILFNTNRPLQSQRQNRGLKFWLYVSRRGIVLSSSENKGAHQLRSYCKADLHLCFRIGINLVFS